METLGGDWPYRTLCQFHGLTKIAAFAKVYVKLAPVVASMWASMISKADGLSGPEEISEMVFVTLRCQCGFGDFTSYQGAVNLNYLVSGLYDASEHASVGEGTLSALRLLFPSLRIVASQCDVLKALLCAVRDKVAPEAKRLFGARAAGWSLQPTEHSLCAWHRLVSGSCKRRKHSRPPLGGSCMFPLGGSCTQRPAVAHHWGVR